VTRLVAVAAMAAVLAVGILLAPLVPAVGGPGPVAAASPEVTPGGGGGGDPRSVGEGPGLVGDPLFAIALVIGIGILAAGLTAVYVRATGGSRRRPPSGGSSRPR
jgi:hypothetical protein